MEGPFCQGDAASLIGGFEDSQDLKFNEDQESAEDSDDEGIDELLEGLLTESKSANSDVERVWEAAEARTQNESFREYAGRRAQAFGYENLREQQLEALEELIEHQRDVMLIAKTSFGKSLIFQLAPLLMPKPTNPGIALILMPLTLLQQNQSAAVMKKGRHLGAMCLVLDGDANTSKNRKWIAEGIYTHSKLIPLSLSPVF